uniref:Chromodomain helicase DNA binding protein 7 n=1 Tax=Cricetulus griseus TaxID=10029 RepID=A0A8C2QG98_CRIGR
MADPGMMSLFGEDGNIFSEGLEGLGECGYPENPVNPMGQQMPMDQGFASLQPSLHHPSTNQNQTKLTHFDHYNQYEQKMHLMDQPNRMMGSAPGNGLASPHSQYHTPPVPQVPHGGSGGGQMGVYPGMQNERHGQSFVDSGSMWGPRAVQVPDQIRAPYQQQQPQPAPSGPPAQGHPQHMQQMGSYMARGDFSMQQHGQPQQRMSQFSQGQEGLNQGNPFIATSGPGHLSHMPQQSPSMAPSLRHSVQQFHHHPPAALHGESVAHSPRFSPNPPQQGAVRPQTLNFSSRSQTVPSPTVNNSGQYSRYPYSNLNQGLVNSTGMNQNLGLTNSTPMNQSVPRYPNAVGFPSNSGQGLMHQQPIHASGSLNQMNTQTMHPSQPQGTYASPPPMSPMKAMSNPAGTPPPQVRPGSAGMPMEVGTYPNMSHPQPSHQPPGAMGLGQRNIGPRNMPQPRPFMGMSSAPRELTGHMRPNGCPGVGLADPQAIQERLIPGQQHPGQQPSFQQLPSCPPLQPHPGLHQSSPPHPHHQPWAQLHPSPQNTPQKVPVHQHSPSEPFLEKPVPDMTQKPKQKRHRCRNPNKLDINTLTGEERVPVVNKRNGKKMGGAMAPPMKDLPRWLEENPEFAVAPDWTDIVKQSGFVPESMFDRLLTGPVVRGEGASRRGRRPKSEIARAAAAAAAVASTSGINPLLVNSLFAGMDLTSLQNLQNLQSLQLAGLMGFPPGLATAATTGGDAKNPAVLPLMLPGMAGLPNVFGLGGLLNNPLSAATGNTTTAAQGEPEDGASKVEEKGNENQEEHRDSEKSTDAVSAADSANGSVGAATAPAALPSNPLAFNPFLLSTMAPGLFYPSMFLPPGLGGLTLPGFPALAGLQNAVGASEEKATDKAEGGPCKDGETLEGSDAEENLDKTAESSILEDEVAQGEELDSLEGGDEIENNGNDE